MKNLQVRNIWIARFSPDHFSFWIIASLFLKAAFVTTFLAEIDFGFHAIGWAKTGLLGYTSGDTPGYLNPIENLLLHGQYVPDYRMPGYGAVYLLLRIFLNIPHAMNAILLIQLLISALSFYCLAQAAYKMTKSKTMFYLTFFIYGLSMRASFWDLGYVTESLTTSFLIFSVYFFVRFFGSQNLWHCVLSGFFLTWAVFLRPVYLPLCLVFPVTLTFLAFRSWKADLRRIVFLFFFFSLPFLFFDGLWIVRNYSRYKSVIPLTRSFYATEFEDSYLSSLMNFVIACGGDRSYWNPRGEIRWYLPDSPHLPPNLAAEPPSTIYTSVFNKDSLLRIKQDIELIESPSTPSGQVKDLNLSVKRRLTLFTSSIKRERPGLFYVTSRIGFLKRFIFHSGTDFLPPLHFLDMNLTQQILKISNSAFYLISVVLGMMGCLFLFLKFDVRLFIFALTGGYSIVIYPLLGQLEPRYFVPAFPFMLVCGLYFLTVITHKLNTLPQKNE